MNADGSSLVQHTSDVPVTTIDEDRSWSPDGTRIAFARSQLQAFAIMTMHPDGSAPTLVASAPFIDFRDPSWSPDGGRLAFDAPQSAACLVYVFSMRGAIRTNIP